MARTLHKLTDATIRRLIEPCLYPDGGGLHLQIARSGAKSWVYRFSLGGRAREMGLGPLRSVTLAEARGRAAEARLLRDRGIDPIEDRRAKIQAAAPVKKADGPTFREFALSYIDGRRDEWKHKKTEPDWRSSLERFAFPVIGNLPIEAIQTSHIIEILQPIWKTKSETASRLRGRIERVLAAASVEGLRQGNCAVFKGHLAEARGLGKKKKSIPYAALPYGELPAFMARLRLVEGCAARALEFAILTCARSGECRGARWPEIEERAQTWTVPGDRMKMGRPHVVPLCARALAILDEMRPMRNLDGQFIFPGIKRGRPLTDMALLKLVKKRMNADATVHGFRATFKTFCEEQTNFPSAVIEAALAHLVGDRVEATYMRGTWLAKRAALMSDWGAYCTMTPVDTVTPIKIPA